MSALEKEIDENFARFHAGWQKQLADNVATLEKQDQLKQSYRRMTALQAIKAKIVVPHYSEGSAAFFLEAQNDVLISHVNASVGAWRSALQSLRSALENALSAVYYKDHAVELELWETGSFRIAASDIRTYISKHPAVRVADPTLKAVEAIEAEYATLSKAVHASATAFRMVDVATEVSLWTANKAKLGMWSTRHERVVQSICLVMLMVHAPLLQGTSQSDLRSSLYFALSASKRTAVKKALNITIPSP